MSGSGSAQPGQTENPADDVIAPRAPRVRAIVAVFLVVASTIGIVLTPVAWWVRNTVFDTDRFMAVVEPTLQSEEIAAAVGDIVAQEVIEAADLAGRLESRLGTVDEFLRSGLADVLDLGPAQRRLLGRLDLPELANLGAPVAAAIESEIEEATRSFMTSAAVQELVPGAVARAHEGAVALIRGEEDELAAVTVVDGEVRLDLQPVITRALANIAEQRVAGGVLEGIDVPRLVAAVTPADARAALEGVLDIELPPDFGQVKVMSETSLRRWQQVGRTFERGVWAITILTLLAIVGAVALSIRRRRTVVQLGLGSVLGLGLARIVRRNVTEAFEGAAADPETEAAVRVVADRLLGDLQLTTLALLAAAAAIALTAHILGRPDWLRSFGRRARTIAAGTGLNRFDGFVADHRDGVMAAGFVLALLVWWWLGVGWASVLLIGGVLALYLLYVTIVKRGNRQREATTADPGD